MNPEHVPETYERKSWWTRFKDGLLGVEEVDEEGIETVAANGSAVVVDAARTRHALRLQTVRNERVAIRLNARKFEDAQRAADGLKEGEHQIVNVEQASPQMRERIVDFLNGVCYAVEGTVERVADKVYLYVPANVMVDVEESALTGKAGVRAPFREAADY